MAKVIKLTFLVSVIFFNLETIVKLINETHDGGLKFSIPVVLPDGFRKAFQKILDDEQDQLMVAIIGDRVTSNKKRDLAHKFYQNLGFENSHEGFRMVF